MNSETTPRDKRTTTDLLIQGMHALRTDVQRLCEFELARRDREKTIMAMLGAIQEQLTQVSLTLQTIADEQLRQSQRCRSIHPSPPSLEVVS